MIKNKYENKKRKILNSLKKAGLIRSFHKKSPTDPYYSRVGSCRKGRLEIKE